MKLIECYIENFGKLSDFKLSFSKGINSIKKNNGYGKTTLAVFIKSMLYGLDDTKRQRLENNERKHYMPWQGGRCGGSLTFETNGKIYRIERTFMPKASEDLFKIYDQKSGKESFDYTKNVGEELFNIDADGFERTVFLSEANLSGKNENKTVSAKLSDLVGYEGDLSVMDDAIELLEKQRKIYYKRGGSGEIGDIKLKLSSVERQIFDLESLKSEQSNEKQHLDQILKELSCAKKIKDDINLKSKEADKARIKNAYAKQYLQMKEELNAELKREQELDAFFINGLPTQEQTDEMKVMWLDAKRIHENTGYDEPQDLTELRQFFSQGISDEEFDKAKELSMRIESKKKEAELLTTHLKKEYNLGKKANENLCKRTALFPALLLILSLLSLTVSFVLGFLLSPAFLSVSIISISLFVIFLKVKSKSKKLQSEYKERVALLTQIDALENEIKQSEAEAYRFISNFKIDNNTSIAEAIREIFRKRDLYLALKSSHAGQAESNRRRLVAAQENAGRIEAFLSRFPTVSAKPFEEITCNAIEFETVRKSITAKKQAMARFAYENGINPDDIGSFADNGIHDSFEAENAENDAKILLLERERTLCERRLSDITDEIDKIDELICEKESLSERASQLEKKVDVILKTQIFLSEAKDNLTSKYLAKTKSAFDKYISIIGNEEAESFTMNTSFEIMKNERGTLRDYEAYSKGTKDLYALAARFALVDSLYDKENPFIILDDPFAHFDDIRLKNALGVIEKLAKERQIIYFTCTDSRKI